MACMADSHLFCHNAKMFLTISQNLCLFWFTQLTFLKNLNLFFYPCWWLLMVKRHLEYMLCLNDAFAEISFDYMVISLNIYSQCILVCILYQWIIDAKVQTAVRTSQWNSEAQDLVRESADKKDAQFNIILYFNIPVSCMFAGFYESLD